MRAEFGGEPPSLLESPVRLGVLAEFEKHLSETTAPGHEFGPAVSRRDRHLYRPLTVCSRRFDPAKIEAHVAAQRDIGKGDGVEAGCFGELDTCVICAFGCDDPPARKMRVGKSAQGASLRLRLGHPLSHREGSLVCCNATLGLPQWK